MAILNALGAFHTVLGSRERVKNKKRGQFDKAKRFFDSAEAVDLLKVDVEGEELNVLRGLDDEAWTRVRQVVLEVHDVDGRVAAVEALLASRGFETRVEDDDMLGLKAARCVVVAGRRPSVCAA